MYHNQPNMIELHDDVVGIKKSRLEVTNGAPVLLHVTYVMRPDREYNADPEADVRLHSTNGVNHRYHPLNSPDPLISDIIGNDVEETLLNGQNQQVIHDDAGEPFLATPLVPANSDVLSPLAAEGEPSVGYREALNYNPENINRPDHAELALRRQQELVDETTAAKRRDGTGPGVANSIRAQDSEANRSNKRQDEQSKDEKRESKREEREEKKDELKDGDSVKLDREDKRGK